MYAVTFYFKLLSQGELSQAGNGGEIYRVIIDPQVI